MSRESSHAIRFATAAIIATTLGLAGCSRSGPYDADLSCNGSTTVITIAGIKQAAVPGQSMQTKIRGNSISFSGLTSLAADNVAMCSTQSSTGLNPGDIYFDSQTCADSPRKIRQRQYGTYNPGSGRLDMTNEIWDDKTSLVQGSFVCKKAKAG